MCGLVGFLGGTYISVNEQQQSIIRKMTDTIVSRGPDDEGYWQKKEHCIALGHRRLAIIDVSAAGQQPMQSASSRYVIAFNGEIYNHRTLRNELAKNDALAITWRGHSDTETLLAGFETWGIQHTIEKCIGMFAFAVWDQQNNTLTLGRDRIGEKPLYYGWQGQGEQAVFLFGSELKALKVHPNFNAAINRDTLCLMMRYNSIPAPYSIYTDIAKLSPGYLLEVSLKQREPKLIPYWSFTQTANMGVKQPFSGSAEQATYQLEQLLSHAVGQQMQADVPLGAFLSGGIDSSLIVALMQAQSSRPVKTFSIGFQESTFNEAVYAKAVAKHLGTEHTELYITPQDALAVIPRLPHLYCEPFGDSSQIPTALVCQLARQHVSVALSGDAGDELFCGYSRYQLTEKIWGKLSHLPYKLRVITAKIILAIPPNTWNTLAAPFNTLLSKALGSKNIGDKLHKGAAVLAVDSIHELYQYFLAHWRNPGELVLNGVEPNLLNQASNLHDLDDIQRMMAQDMLGYLPNDILVKVDRAAMGVSLETRVPFLDHRVVEFAWQLPQKLKLHQGQTKWILRQVLQHHMPNALIERPKMGFAIPIDQWLRGPLRDWCEALINESRLRQEGFFNTPLIQKKWQEHISGRHNWGYLLWNVLMFQAWLDHN